MLTKMEFKMKFVIEIQGNEVVLTREEALAIYEELKSVFQQNTTLPLSPFRELGLPPKWHSDPQSRGAQLVNPNIRGVVA